MTATSQSSGLRVTAGTVIFAGRHLVNGLLATAGNTVTIYDNAVGDTSGDVIARLENPGTTTLTMLFPVAVRCNLGLTMVSAAGNGAIVYYGGL